MTTRDSMSETPDCCGDSAAYLLGALDSEEAERFRRHAESCVVCRDELSTFGGVVDLLPTAAPPYRAPKGLRRRIMREVRSDPTVATRPRRVRPRISARMPRLALAGGLLAAAALAIAGGIELAGAGSNPARVIRASVTGSSASAQLKIAGTHAELVVKNLPPPPAGRIYEVWLKRGRHAPSPTQALFSVTSAGAAEVGVPGAVRGVSAVMVTQEPAGGSLVPTRPPVIVAKLA